MLTQVGDIPPARLLSSGWGQGQKGWSLEAEGHAICSSRRPHQAVTAVSPSSGPPAVQLTQARPVSGPDAKTAGRARTASEF